MNVYRQVTSPVQPVQSAVLHTEGSISIFPANHQQEQGGLVLAIASQKMAEMEMPRRRRHVEGYDDGNESKLTSVFNQKTRKINKRKRQSAIILVFITVLIGVSKSFVCFFQNCLYNYRILKYLNQTFLSLSRFLSLS
jgi:hypothetical protein